MSNVFCASEGRVPRAALRHANPIHGGVAQIKEFDLNLWYRRAAAWTMKLGRTFEHRAKIAQALELSSVSPS